MKILTLLIIGIVILNLDCSAENKKISPSSKKLELESFCLKLSEMSEIVMTNRQNGVAMSKMIENTPSAEPSVIIDLAKEMITNAYEQPRMHTDENIKRAIEDFRDATYLSCIKQAKK